MKKLLVPTDFSEQAENALKVAAQLAKKHDCEIYLLHILEMPLHKVDALNSYSDLPEAVFFMKLAHRKFEAIKSKDYLDGLVVHETVDFHEIFKGIFHVCKKHDIDLIIMGSNGISGLREMLIGSNTEKVVRTSETPVLVVKNEHKTFKVKDFVFASDFKEESKSTYKKAIKFANVLDAKMHLLMVNTPNKFITSQDANKRMQDFATSSTFSNYTINFYNDMSIEKGIMNFSQSIKADLIGMSTHGRQGISHFFNGSISEDLVNHAKRPVITFKI
ncbi:Nucleotide-binding universal stress protein, UspA family [Flaviramulus basaltis]|uniref:Nucleotide-binding universal stress protein, UspA family n=1 Tax=Flaviramulus basaltis TaxID=369401 RepID=A0A1K2IGD9_9FLAO|nr:universal stress protein [Flaviramulus basaltis]SFZ90731.1 Nucleotide-binding universal stress protein, UspA family [Flaviramulus basaltis]